MGFVRAGLVVRVVGRGWWTPRRPYSVLALVALKSGLRRTARRLTADPDLRDDLVQEARIRLWETDPTRFDLEDQEDLRYLCRILTNRMWQVWKAEVGRCVA